MNRVTLAEHPTRNASGGSAFPQLREIRLDGKRIGYTGDPPFHRISFIDHWAGEEKWVEEEAVRLVEAEFGVKPDRVTNVPEPVDGENLDGDEE